jgi:GNAT superfamily N-acetyltransferase
MLRRARSADTPVSQSRRIVIAIQTFDPHNASRDQWDAFHRVRRVLFAEDAPERPIPDDATIEARYRIVDPHWCSRWLLAFEGEVPVGRMQVATRGGEDPSRYAGRVFVFGGVSPDRRRKGVGMALARQLLALMRDEMHAVAAFPVSSVDLGRPFLDQLGAQLVYQELDNRLSLAGVEWAAVAMHIDKVPSRLRWEEHLGRVPLQRLQQLAPQMNALLADVPREGLSFPPPLFELASYQALYRRMDEFGGAHFMVMLLDGEELVAVCESAIHSTSLDVATQNFTGVSRSWRGRGLGRAVKARTLQFLRDHRPEVRSVQTKNAATNAPMLRVNAKLGFSVHRESGVFEASLETLERTLGHA